MSTDLKKYTVIIDEGRGSKREGRVIARNPTQAVEMCRNTEDGQEVTFVLVGKEWGPVDEVEPRIVPDTEWKLDEGVEIWAVSGDLALNDVRLGLIQGRTDLLLCLDDWEPVPEDHRALNAAEAKFLLKAMQQHPHDARLSNGQSGMPHSRPVQPANNFRI